MDFIKKHIEWILAIAIIGILAPSLLFKFGGAAEPAHIFNVVGEWIGLDFFKSTGQYIIGGVEALICVLMLKPSVRVFGAVLSAGTMAGAIIFHLFSPLGVTVKWMENGEMQEDGSLFYMACVAFICSLIIMWRRKDQLLALLGRKSG
ncbi:MULTISPECIES: hypothetical protein [Kordiimonas]|jgi:hypothetical protein|uniref:hypothetical protein n=1 Tax=Kordiimonas TaxID=288021 RepID=UPI00257A08A9|nr:hypothetical protein [Kordiimonas sp. UBA4487]